MRLDARSESRQDWRYQVFDCEVCKYRRDVVWVDDVMGQYGIYTGRHFDGELEIEIIFAKILIISECSIVFINPKEDRQQLMDSISFTSPHPSPLPEGEGELQRIQL